VQQYDYSFDGATGHLNSRQNSLRSLSETFGYDTEKLDRLTSVTGPSAQTLGYQSANKGNILTKTDAGTYEYDPVKKYALKMITNGVNISTTDQDISYTAFNKVHQITEGTKTAEFIYNADNQRIRMILKNNGSVTKTRWYFGGSCEREQVGSTVTEYIWIGGDAYTAVAVAKKIGTGSWVVYNIFRDHLGTITHLKNGSSIDEYSYDAWGRRRDKDNWSYTLSGEPTLFADRGFTGHEYLEDFNLYNMNGRLYDPVVGRFLSPDPYIADPSFTQSYNRYSYVLNNPLKYNDPTGELPFLAWLGIAWAGNYLMGVADNHINKGMSVKDAFRNTNIVAGVNFSPSDMSRSNKFGFSSIQVDAQKAALHEERVSAYLTAWEKEQSGRGNPQGQGGSNWATATLAFIAADVAVPEPTDVAWPKWVVYGVAGTAAAVSIHANSKNSPKPNIVYEIYSYNSITGYQTMKYGVSSRADFVTRSGNPRPEYQVMSLNAVEPVGSGTYYWYTILNRTPDRASALSLEQSYVRAYQATHGGLRPPLQIRP
jgi:RHS repeat-associated protein